MFAAGLHYFPLSAPFLLLLVTLLGVVVILVLARVLRYAYVSMGIAPQYVFAVLLASLLGSYVNIPILQFPGERVLEAQQIDFFGMRYVIPIVRDWPGTIVAVNVGGAVIPTLMSLYLMMKNALYGSALIGVVIAAGWHGDRPALDPLTYGALRLADESARGVGIWIGCVRSRDFRGLLPRRPPEPRRR